MIGTEDCITRLCHSCSISIFKNIIGSIVTHSYNAISILLEIKTKCVVTRNSIVFYSQNGQTVHNPQKQHSGSKTPT